MLLGLWGDGDGRAHGGARRTAAVAVLVSPVRDGSFPSVGRLHPPAMRLERAIATCSASCPTDAPDERPWLDHGQLGRQPRRSAPPAAGDAHAAYASCRSRAKSLHQIPVGPVHAGIIEPGHFRFTANGETVVRLEERLGYVHKGIEALLTGATSLERGAARRPRDVRRLARSPTPSRSPAPSRRRSEVDVPPRARCCCAR